jgi:hypothetical protein
MHRSEWKCTTGMHPGDGGRTNCPMQHPADARNLEVPGAPGRTDHALVGAGHDRPSRTVVAVHAASGSATIADPVSA